MALFRPMIFPLLILISKLFKPIVKSISLILESLDGPVLKMEQALASVAKLVKESLLAVVSTACIKQKNLPHF